MIDIRNKPFYLDDEAVKWVTDTLESMDNDQKIGQLFIHMMIPFGEHVQDASLEKMTKDWMLGGIMYRPGEKDTIRRTSERLQSMSAIPMLIAANLDSGGDGIVCEGTRVGAQMNMAATGDTNIAYLAGKVSAKEGLAVGCNWTFAPIIDIDYNWRNPITNTRTFGSDPAVVKAMAKSFVRGDSEQKHMAACIKHFPGDGVDERDQHLMTTVNDLPAERWMETYGSIYRDLIDQGVPTVMVGHILQPAWQKKLNPSLKDNQLLPATLSSELLKGLLRDILGFNGLIVTDASQMLGFTTAVPRRLAVPGCIEAGCDMFLFGKCIEEDIQYMRQGLAEGILSQKRLDEAVTRVLALKAHLSLHKKSFSKKLVPESVIGCAEHKAAAKACADHSITLVRDRDGLLPFTPERFRRILLILLGGEVGFISGSEVSGYVKQKFVEAGFDVEIYDGHDTMFDSFEDYRSKYDAVAYVANITTASNQTSVRISWKKPICADGPFFAADVPTIFISLANPYHYVDVPSIGTIINAYSASDEIIDALMEKLSGKSEFVGISPVNPYGDRWVAEN